MAHRIDLRTLYLLRKLREANATGIIALTGDREFSKLQRRGFVIAAIEPNVCCHQFGPLRIWV